MPRDWLFDAAPDRADRFHEFWSAYPRKTAKAVAEKVFRALNPTDEEFQRILAAVDAHRHTKQWQDPTFIPHPATFLRQRRFDDPLPVVLRPRTLGPAYGQHADWRDECLKFHKGGCTNAHFHAARMSES